MPVSALSVSCRLGHVDVVDFLLDSELCDPNETDEVGWMRSLRHAALPLNAVRAAWIRMAARRSWWPVDTGR
jgi:hypothetical protein